MYVARVPNRGSPPAVLLRESFREGGKMKNRTLANLSRWPDDKVAALQAVLATLRRLGLDEVISPEPSHNRDLVIVMICAQAEARPEGFTEYLHVRINVYRDR